MSNKLFCTFSTKEVLDETINKITTKYSILFNKMFVLYAKELDEYLITYNVEAGNISGIIENTILVHRKKESSTLYTINALNALIKTLNNGVLDTSYQINWNDYKNSILLTSGSDFKKVGTTLHTIKNLA
jgi:hypothetical protein